MNINDIDLKSLEVLEALVTEKNVTRAAKRVGLSQPAVSNTLLRLRKQLGDPLLVRTQGGMIPTSRAEALIPSVREAREILSRALFPKETFTPQKAEQSIHLAATDYSAWLLLPGLCKDLAKDAPKLRLEITPLTERVPARALERGEIDLALGFFPDAPAHLYQQELFSEDFVAVTKKTSVTKLSAKEFSSLRHVLVVPWGGNVGTLDTALSGLSLKRTVFVSLTHFLVAPAIVAEMDDSVVTLPRRLALSFKESLSLSVIELPVKLPTLNFRQLWHERTHWETSHRWFRTKVAGRAGQYRERMVKDS